MRRALACLFVALMAAPAAACINDQESPAHEREFRSDYGDAPYPEKPKGPLNLANSLLFGGGSALLLGALIVPRITRKPRA